MARRRSSTPADLLTDPGVLDGEPALEVFGWRAAAATGGLSILPRRGEWLAAREAGIGARGWFDPTAETTFKQAVVHLQKGRAATWQGLAEAWDRIAPGGRLMLVGGNDLGIKSAVKRLSAELEQPAEITANRARARVACWRRQGPSTPTRPVVPPVAVEIDGTRFDLRSAPGVFSADGVDPGSGLLLAHLADLPEPTKIFDPGCGLGVLGLAALRRWPAATALLADADRRAVDCAAGSAADLGLADRCEVAWWDAARDPAPPQVVDLVLVNPPFHSGVPVDLQPARAIFRAIDAVLWPGGRVVVVANRTLPWESDLGAIGRLRQIDDRLGYKVLEIVR
jgi:16S rRNA (guanine1207-N2)-methyltransferase